MTLRHTMLGGILGTLLLCVAPASATPAGGSSFQRLLVATGLAQDEPGSDSMPQQLGGLLRSAARRRGYEELAPGEQARVDRARLSFHDFVEYCFVDHFGQACVQQPFHDEWFELAQTHPRLVLWAPVEHGKTRSLTIYRTLWILGHNPNATMAIISETATKANRIMREIRNLITDNVRLHRVFPSMRRGDLWQENQISVERTSQVGDPSVQALGVGGQINGARLTHVLGDDVLSFNNTYSATRRAKVLDWFDAEVFGRMLRPLGAAFDAMVGDSFVLVGTAWHREDTMHQMALRPRFHAARYRSIWYRDPSRRDAQVEILDPTLTDADVECLWPERFNVQRLRDFCLDTATGGTINFARQHLNLVRDDASSVFREVLIERARQLGIRIGARLEGKCKPTAGEYLSVGVDLSTGEDVEHDLKVFNVTLRSNDVYRIVWAESGRWGWAPLMDKFESYDERFSKPDFWVESNYGQKFVAEGAKHKIPEARIHPVQTGEDKHHPTYGIAMLALLMERDEYALPVNADGEFDPEIEALAKDMLFYSSTDRHTPDRLDAAWRAVAGLERRRAVNWSPAAEGRGYRRLA